MTTIQELVKRMEALEKENNILKKVADKQRLSRYAENVDHGTSVKVTVYQRDDEDTPRIVTSWRLLRDHVSTGKDAVENQVMELTLDDQGALEKAQKAYERLVDPKKKEEKEEEIAELKKKNVVEMSYLDFAVYKTSKIDVKLKGTETIDGVSRAIFSHNDKEYRIPLTFVN
jgi:hypothetical protein